MQLGRIYASKCAVTDLCGVALILSERGKTFMKKKNQDAQKASELLQKLQEAVLSSSKKKEARSETPDRDELEFQKKIASMLSRVTGDKPLDEKKKQTSKPKPKKPELPPPPAVEEITETADENIEPISQKESEQPKKKRAKRSNKRLVSAPVKKLPEPIEDPPESDEPTVESENFIVPCLSETEETVFQPPEEDFETASTDTFTPSEELKIASADDSPSFEETEITAADDLVTVEVAELLLATDDLSLPEEFETKDPSELNTESSVLDIEADLPAETGESEEPPLPEQSAYKQEIMEALVPEQTVTEETNAEDTPGMEEPVPNPTPISIPMRPKKPTVTVIKPKPFEPSPQRERNDTIVIKPKSTIRPTDPIVIKPKKHSKASEPIRVEVKTPCQIPRNGSDHPQKKT